MIHAGKLIGKSSPLGDSRLSKAALDKPNDVASRQHIEGVERNAEVFDTPSENLSQQINPIRQKLQGRMHRGSSAGYEGGKSTYIEMDGSGYGGMPKKGATNNIISTPAQLNPSAALPQLFDQNISTSTDYRHFKGNLDR